VRQLDQAVELRAIPAPGVPGVHRLIGVESCAELCLMFQTLNLEL
jgi:hypothetical protein